MRLIVIGGSGTIGRRLVPALIERDHEIVVAGRNSGELRVDITSADAIDTMYRDAGPVDGVIVIAAMGDPDDVATLTKPQLLNSVRASSSVRPTWC